MTHYHAETYDDHDHDPVEDPTVSYNGRGHWHLTEEEVCES